MQLTRLSMSLLPRIARRPSLAFALLQVAWRFRRRGWWHRFPFLPLPSEEYIRWRMHTAYGDSDATPPAADVERYAVWAVRK